MQPKLVPARGSITTGVNKFPTYLQAASNLYGPEVWNEARSIPEDHRILSATTQHSVVQDLGTTH
jgi:hypothetical protein